MATYLLHLRYTDTDDDDTTLIIYNRQADRACSSYAHGQTDLRLICTWTDRQSVRSNSMLSRINIRVRVRVRVIIVCTAPRGSRIWWIHQILRKPLSAQYYDNRLGLRQFKILYRIPSHGFFPRGLATQKRVWYRVCSWPTYACLFLSLSFF